MKNIKIGSAYIDLLENADRQKGNANFIIEEVLSNLAKYRSEQLEETKLILILRTAALLRLVINILASHNSDFRNRIVYLKTLVSKISIKIYEYIDHQDNSKYYEIIELLGQLGSELGEKASTLSYPLNFDSLSIGAVKDDSVESTVRVLEEKINGSKYLFICIGGGGFISGIEVFNTLQELEDRRGEFYPIRFSREKSKDDQPQLSSEEIEYLKVKVKSELKIILYDDDFSTGGTIVEFGRYLKSKLGNDPHIYISSGYKTPMMEENTIFLEKIINTPKGKDLPHVGWSGNSMNRKRPNEIKFS